MHTPTPYEAERHERCPRDDQPDYWSIEAAMVGRHGAVADTLNRDFTLSPEDDRANAAFIVRACNCFDELLAACKMSAELLEVMADQGPRDADAMEARDKVRAIIAKAEAQS